LRFRGPEASARESPVFWNSQHPAGVERFGPALGDRRERRGRRRFHRGATMSGTPHEKSDPRLPLLNKIQIESPCHAAWDGMSGSDRERHCESCAKTVHNLIEHTNDEAYRLVTEASAHVCVRIHRDAAGNIVTKDTLAALQPTRRTFLSRWATFAASCLGLSSLIGCKRVERVLTPSSPGELGDVCPPQNAGANPNGTGDHEVVLGNLQCPPNLNLPKLPDAIPASAPITPAPSASSPKSLPTK
jgi:hypothetical protein